MSIIEYSAYLVTTVELTVKEACFRIDEILNCFIIPMFPAATDGGTFHL